MGLGSKMYSRWTTRDLVVGSVLAVAVGVVFWAWGLLWSSVFGNISFPFSYLYVGMWMTGGLLVAYVVRKPGAALLGELVAAFVSMAIGTQWGLLVMASGLVQGACAEAVFAAGGWKRFGGAWIYAAGAASGLSIILDVFVYHYFSLYSGTAILIAGAFSVVSSAILGGGFTQLLGRSLGRTGVLVGLGIATKEAKRI
jgi:energy-coupling factor transport system permease protein